MERINWNKDWIFYPDGQEKVAQQIHLPHDAMLHRERVPKLKNGSYVGFFPSGDYWYEKKFTVPEQWIGKRIIIEFEGIYMDSTVYLNGQKLGGRVYGYSEFRVDLTDKLRFGAENELRIFVHCSQVPNSRWYPGNGIYRPVWLYVTEEKHIDPLKFHIAAISYEPAVVELKLDEPVAESCALEWELGGVQSCIPAGETVRRMEIPNAKLWSADMPNLYDLKLTLREGEKIQDIHTQKFGIRTLAWNSAEGFLVNGKPVKLRGGCVHHDNGPLGACEFKEAAYRRIRIMKEAGFNAIRSSHYPISRNLLDACDEMGMYIMDESFDSWEESAGLYGYIHHFHEDWAKDTEAMVRKDRNHPSVVIYSIGNEVGDVVTDQGLEWAKKMTDLCHSLDPYIPVTVCPNVMMCILGKKGLSLSISGDKIPKIDDVTDPMEEAPDSDVGGSALINIIVDLAPTLMKMMLKPKAAEAACGPVYGIVDVAGYNYANAVYEGNHKSAPNRVMLGSETNPPAIFSNWQKVKNNPYVIGDFMWTGWDYLGEVGVGIIDYGKKVGGFTKPYPAISAYCGAIDLTGKPDTLSYLAGIVWGTYQKPYIGVCPVNHSGEKRIVTAYRHTDAVHSWSWTGCEGRKAKIEVYSPGETVELLQNGKSLGRKKLKECSACFKTVYTPGTLEAIAYDAGGKEIGRDRLISAGQRTRLTLWTEKQTLASDGEDLAYVHVAVTDEQGIPKMLCEKNITVTVEGCGSLQAVGSGNPRPNESYTGNHFTTYQGEMLAIIRAGEQKGSIRVAVSAPDTDTQYIELQAN